MPWDPIQKKWIGPTNAFTAPYPQRQDVGDSFAVDAATLATLQQAKATQPGTFLATSGNNVVTNLSSVRAAAGAPPLAAAAGGAPGLRWADVRGGVPAAEPTQPKWGDLRNLFPQKTDMELFRMNSARNNPADGNPAAKMLRSEYQQAVASQSAAEQARTAQANALELTRAGRVEPVTEANKGKLAVADVQATTAKDLRTTIENGLNQRAKDLAEVGKTLEAQKATDALAKVSAQFANAEKLAIANGVTPKLADGTDNPAFTAIKQASAVQAIKELVAKGEMDVAGTIAMSSINAAHTEANAELKALETYAGTPDDLKPDKDGKPTVSLDAIKDQKRKDIYTRMTDQVKQATDAAQGKVAAIGAAATPPAAAGASTSWKPAPEGDSEYTGTSQDGKFTLTKTKSGKFFIEDSKGAQSIDSTWVPWVKAVLPKDISEEFVASISKPAAGASVAGDANKNGVPDAEEAQHNDILGFMQKYDALPEGDPQKAALLAKYDKAKMAAQAFRAKYKASLGGE
jgi:hypothetical protein